eukprot:9619947-Alexandrium_andersonii.AAC.1
MPLSLSGSLMSSSWLSRLSLWMLRVKGRLFGTRGHVPKGRLTRGTVSYTHLRAHETSAHL